jgi:hypothetical protein
MRLMQLCACGNQAYVCSVASERLITAASLSCGLAHRVATLLLTVAAAYDCLHTYTGPELQRGAASHSLRNAKAQ